MEFHNHKKRKRKRIKKKAFSLFHGTITIILIIGSLEGYRIGE